MSIIENSKCQALLFADYNVDWDDFENCTNSKIKLLKMNAWAKNIIYYIIIY